MIKELVLGSVLVATVGCGVSTTEEAVSSQGAGLTLSSGGATASLKCRNVGSRWQICGDASRTKILAGVGIRFFKPGPDGALVAASTTHASCSAALADTSVPVATRDAARPLCGQLFAVTTGELTAPVPVVVDPTGAVLSWDTLSVDQRRVVGRAVGEVLSRDPGTQAIGCDLGPGLSISCWGNGKMCAAWIDEDGSAGAQCWTCEVADCS